MKTVVILGAGASTEFLAEYQESPLSTQRLTYILSKNLHLFWDYLQDFYDEKEIFWLRDLWFELIASLRKFFGDNYNFEHIIHLGDIISDIYVSKNSVVYVGKESLISNIYLVLVDFFGGKVDSYLGQILFSLPEILRYFILDYICDYHYPSFKYSHYKDDYEIWKNFLIKFAYDGPLSIFSLNYDSLLYEIIANINKSGKCYIETGVDIEKLALENGSEVMDLDRIKNAKNVFIPLHGSVHFVPEIGSVRFCRNCKYAKKERRGRAVSRKTKQDGTHDYNQIMITGLSKFDAVAKEPFSTFYTRLVKDIIETDRIFIIGYGGADKHLNMLLKSSYCIAKEVHYITKLEDVYLNNYSLLEHLSWKEFGFCVEFLPDDCFKKESKNLEISDKICIGERCFVYPRGTRYFLKNLGEF